MKNIKKILFSFILICTFFAFSKNVFATEEIQTSCEYSAPMLGVDYYYKLKIDVYDNGTKKLNYYNGTTWIEIDASSGRYYSIDTIPYFDKKGLKGTSNYGIEINISSFSIQNYNCPILVSNNSDGLTTSITFDHNPGICNDDELGIWCEKSEQKNSDNYDKESDENKDRVISTCEIKTKPYQFDTVNSTELSKGVIATFSTYLSGNREFCIKINDDSSPTCELEKSSYNGNYAVSTQNYLFSIYNSQVEKIFLIPENSSTNVSILCPSYLYLIAGAEDFGTGIKPLYFTTDTEEAKKYIDNAWGESGVTTVIDDYELVDPNNGFKLGDFKGCGIMQSEKAGEKGLGDWLVMLLSIVKIFSVLLTIILSFIDAIKSIASSDDKFGKKFYKRLLIRLISCGLLFLIPSIIQMLLGIFSSNEIIKNIMNNPFCGLF